MTSYLNPNKFLCNAVQFLFPWRFRRMLVMGGLYGAISSADKPLLDHAKELSEVLRLSKDPALVEAPIAFHSVLVTKVNKLNVQVDGREISLRDVLERELTEQERNALSTALVNRVRPALRYSQPRMVQDFYNMLGFINTKRTQTA